MNVMNVMPAQHSTHKQLPGLMRTWLPTVMLCEGNTAMLVLS